MNSSKRKLATDKCVELLNLKETYQGELRIAVFRVYPHLIGKDNVKNVSSFHIFDAGSVFIVLGWREVFRQEFNHYLRVDREFEILSSRGICFVADVHLDYTTRRLV